MKNKLYGSLLLSTLLSSGACAAPYALAISVDTTRFDYAETGDNGELLDTERSEFGDIAGFTFAFEPDYQGFYITTSYSSGTTDYIGGTDVNPTYGSYLTTTNNTILDYSAGFKTTFLLDPYGELQMPLQVGLGYREWQRDILGTYDVYGITETYEWGYFDVGIGLHLALSPDATIGVDANYRKAFNAQMYEDLYGHTFTLNNVYGYTIAVPLEFALNRSVSAFFQYNYEYWNIDASNVVDGWYEPDSETKNQTLSAGLKIWF